MLRFMEEREIAEWMMWRGLGFAGRLWESEEREVWHC